MTAKETVIELVKQMPEDATVPDIVTKLYLRQQIDERIQEVEAGEWVDHDQALKSLAKWRE